jgi:hypothetical protein
MLVFPLLGGLLAWLLVALAGSLRTETWLVMRAAARRVWRRDAAIALGVALAVFAGVGQVQAWMAARFHAHAPPEVELVPGLLDTFLPAAAYFLRGLFLVLILPALAAVVISLLKPGLVRRAWWVWPAGLLLLISLGPADAQSVTEYCVGWVAAFLAVAALVGLVWAFFRDNALAYVLVAFAYPVAQPLVGLWRQEAGFYRANAVLLGLLAGLFLFWALRGKPEGPQDTTGGSDAVPPLPQ